MGTFIHARAVSLYKDPASSAAHRPYLTTHLPRLWNPRNLSLFYQRRTMAVTMTDGPNRKACDRCHTQKLSCKRVGDEACERCIRLKTQCKSSPSLRYRKQHQHQQPTDDVVRRSISSPKRQRIGGGSQVVQPDLCESCVFDLSGIRLY